MFTVHRDAKAPRRVYCVKYTDPITKIEFHVGDVFQIKHPSFTGETMVLCITKKFFAQNIHKRIQIEVNFRDEEGNRYTLPIREFITSLQKPSISTCLFDKPLK